MKPYQKVCTILALILMFGGKYFPSVLGLNPVGMATVCIFIATVLLLITVSLSWPVLLMLFAFAFNGIYTFNGAMKDCFGNTIFWFVLFNSIAIGAIERTGLLKRIALNLISNPIAQKSPWLFLITFYTALLLCGSVMNTTAVTLLFFALMFEVLKALDIQKGNRTGINMLFVVMIMANISHAATPFGHTITMMSINNFAELGGFDFGQYTMWGYIVSVVGLVATLLMAKFCFKLDASALENFDASVLKKDLGVMKREEKIAAVLLAGIIIWWMLPTILQNINADLYKLFNSQLSYVAPVAVAIIIMSLIRVDGKPMMNLSADIKNAAWGAALPVAASMFLGTALSNADAGVVDAISTAATPLCANLSPFVFVAIICLLVLVMTNFTSCTLSITVGSIVAVALISGGAIGGVHTGALAVAMAMCAQAAYATPPASGPAAIYSGYGWTQPGEQLRNGFVYAFVWYAVAMVAYLVIAAVA